MNDSYPAQPAGGGRKPKPLAAAKPLNIVILGLSITSSWGNGHATTYRALVRALVDRGHRVLFLERNMPWYAENRDLPNPLMAVPNCMPISRNLRPASRGRSARRTW